MSETAVDLGQVIGKGIRRSRGRAGRVISLTVKLTRAEREHVEELALAKNQAAGEWAREQLLAVADRPKDDILLTELIGLRMFLVNLLRPIALGEDYTDEQFRALLDHVRAEKRSVTSQVTEQYRHDQKEQ